MASWDGMGWDLLWVWCRHRSKDCSLVLQILLVTDGCDPTVMIICYVLVSYSPSLTKEDLSFTKDANKATNTTKTESIQCMHNVVNNN